MNSLEKKMVDILIDLKENHHVVGVKAEFETEGTRLEEALRLKEVVAKAGLDLTIKVGGGGALKEMHEAKTIGVNTIVAPMIESAYAMKKYIQATKLAFSAEERKETSFFINIETITGYNNLDEMLNLIEADDLAGIVFGRADMAGSLNMQKEEVNSDTLFELAEDVALKAQKSGKQLIVGGGVSPLSLDFFKRLPFLNKFETRKVIFDSKALADNRAEEGILKAVEFELLWLKNKRDFYGMIHDEDAKRLIMLETQVKKSVVRQ